MIKTSRVIPKKTPDDFLMVDCGGIHSLTLKLKSAILTRGSG